jgi:hypothetical protein
MRKILALLILLAIPAVAQFGGPMGGMRPGSMQGGGLLPGRGGDPLWVAAGPTKPKLDLDFAKRKDLTDAVSGKTSLVTFSRSAAQSPGTYVGSDGLIHDAAVNLALYSEQFDNAVWTKSGADIAANQIIAPDGKQTADEIRAKAITTSLGIYGTGASLVSGTTYSISAHFKYVNHQWIWIRGDRPSTVWQAFDIQNGVVGNAYDPGNVISNPSIQSVGDGWYRVSFNMTTTSSGVSNIVYRLGNGSTPTGGSVTTLGTERMGVWGAQLEETDAATMAPTAYIKTTSQALAAPRFDHEPTTGNLTTNLATYSEMLDNAAWIKVGATVTANQATAPDGTQTSDSMLMATSGQTPYQLYTFANGVTYTFSVYVKRNTATNQVFQLAKYQTSHAYSAELTATDEWQRFSFSFVGDGSPTSSSFFFRKGPSVASADILVWGAQLEAASSAGPYVRTLGETRSISDANAESLGLLVEEQRTNLITDSNDLLAAGFSELSATPASGKRLLLKNQISGPESSTLLSKLVESADYDQQRIYRAYTSLPIGTTYTYSGFFGAAGRDFVILRTTTSSGGPHIFNLSTGEIAYDPSGTATITDFGNGIYRCSITFTTTSSLEVPWIALSNDGVTDTYTGDGVSGVYVGLLQLEAGAFPTSYIPTVTSQTRYADIAAVQDEDFATTNLISYSESFDVGWSTNRLRPVVANATTAPDGTTTADYIEQESGQSAGGALIVSAPYVGQQIASVYAKAGEKNFLRITDLSTNTAWFDLQNGTVGTVTGTKPASIEDVGNGWYRCSVSMTSTGTGALLFYLADADNSTTVTDSGGVYLWGASLTATEYPVEYVTTRNLLTDSQDFERASWVKSQATIYDDAAQAPDGTLTADRIAQTAVNSFHYIYKDVAVVSGQQYTHSVYAKQGGYIGFYLYAVGPGGFLQVTRVDLSNGTFNANQHNATITDVGDGWYRITSEHVPSSGTLRITMYPLQSFPPVAETGDGTSGIYLWGSQLEPGTTATDYVRTVDVVGKAYGFYEPTEGTVFVEAQAAKQGFGGQLWFNRDQLINRGWSVVSSSTTAQNVYYRADDNSLKNLSLGSVTENSVNKMVSAIDADDVLGAINGGTVQSAALTAYYVFNQLRIGHQYTAGDNKTLNGHIKRLTYWSVRQADSTLQVITQ